MHNTHHNGLDNAMKYYHGDFIEIESTISVSPFARVNEAYH